MHKVVLLRDCVVARKPAKAGSVLDVTDAEFATLKANKRVRDYVPVPASPSPKSSTKEQKNL